MSPRFGYLWLRHLNSNRQRGFALPMALMLGVVMVVVGVTLLVQSSGDQTKAVSAKQKGSANAAAEAALSRIQAIFANPNSRVMALYDKSDWALMQFDESDPNSPEPISDPSNPTYSFCGIGGSETAKSYMKELKRLALQGPNNYTEIASAEGGMKLAFRIKEYDYGPMVTGKSPNGKATSRLTVLGQLQKADGTGVGESQVSIDLPITGEYVTATTKVPALWANYGGIDKNTWEDRTTTETVQVATNSRNATLNGDVLFSDCSNTLDDDYVEVKDPTGTSLPSSQSACENFVDSTGYSDYRWDSSRNDCYSHSKPNDVDSQLGTGYGVEKTTLVMPEVPAGLEAIAATAPDLYGYLNDGGTDGGKNKITTLNSAFNASKGYNPPAGPGDLSSYKVYRIGGNWDQADIEVPSGEKVILWVTGNIGKVVDVLHTGNPENVLIFGTATYNAGSPPFICLNGNREMNAVVHAPNYDAGRTGSSLFNGSFMVRSWGKTNNCMNNASAPSLNSSYTYSQIPTSLWPRKPSIATMTAYQALDTTTSASAAPTTVTAIAAPSVSSSSSSSSSSVSSSSSSSSNSSSSVAMCTLSNYIGTKINDVPNTWQGQAVTKLSGNGNYTVNQQTPSAGSVPCSSNVTVGP